MLEAKGPGYAQFISPDLQATPPWYRGEGNTIDQAERQAEAALANGRRLEWHFAEKLASEYYARRFRVGTYARMISVIYDPPLQ